MPDIEVIIQYFVRLTLLFGQWSIKLEATGYLRNFTFRLVVDL